MNDFEGIEIRQMKDLRKNITQTVFSYELIQQEPGEGASFLYSPVAQLLTANCPGVCA